MTVHIKCVCGRRRGDHSDMVITDRYDRGQKRLCCIRGGCHGTRKVGRFVGAGCLDITGDRSKIHDLRAMWVANRGSREPTGNDK